MFPLTHRCALGAANDVSTQLLDGLALLEPPRTNRHKQPVAKQQLNTEARLNGVKPCRTSPFENGAVRRGAWSTFAFDN